MWKAFGLSKNAIILGSTKTIITEISFRRFPNQLIRRYTKKGDTILELFAGSGTTLFECERLNRNYIGFDINSAMIDRIYRKMEDTQNIRFVVNDCDVTDSEKMNVVMQQSFKWCGIQSADFLIAHPPYMDIVKFTKKNEDLSNISDLQTFIEKFTISMKNGLAYLEKNKYFAVIIGDVYKKSEVVPLGFYVMNAIK